MLTEVTIKETQKAIIHDTRTGFDYIKAEKLGEGGQASVYKVYKVSAQKEVFACKIWVKEKSK